jgi:hypothetical protein
MNVYSSSLIAKYGLEGSAKITDDEGEKVLPG